MVLKRREYTSISRRQRRSQRERNILKFGRKVEKVDKKKRVSEDMRWNLKSEVP
jgi:hypothetical protein